MAFRSNGPVVLALPPFRGVTRRIILTAIAMYLLLVLLGAFVPDMMGVIAGIFTLVPNNALPRELWQFVTYPFVGFGLLSVAFALLSVWYFGSSLEEERGSLWLTEFFLVTTAGGGIVASVLARMLDGRLLGIDPATACVGMWPFSVALLIAFATFHPNESVTFNFILRLKAKYLAALYLVISVAMSVHAAARFDAFTTVWVAVMAYVYARFAPRRGLRTGFSEWWFGLRNAYYRSQRRRAAKKFTVYMRKQGKEVSLDDEGRYIDPNGKPRDLNDRNWMN
jgi:membrane associated rhomboid family serine protease